MVCSAPMPPSRSLRLLAAALLALVLAACPDKPPPEDPKAKAEGLYLAGTAAYLQGNFAQAHDFFAQVKALNPADPRLPAAEGETYLAEVKLTEALAAFEAAAKVDPKRATNYSRIGFIHQLKGERAEAKAALGKALELNPRDFNAHESLGELALRDHEAAEAVKQFMLASESAPDQSKAELVLRAAQALADKPAEALEILERAVRQGIKSPPLFVELGDQLVHVTRLSDAVAAYTEAAKSNPKDPTIWELVGELDAKLDKPGDAEAAFRESLRVKDRAVVHVALARLCLQRKDEPCVAAELALALEKATGEELRESLELADLLEQRGKKKEAFALLEAVAGEPEQEKNAELQFKTARLAKALGNAAAQKKSCALALAAGASKCP